MLLVLGQIPAPPVMKGEVVESTEQGDKQAGLKDQIDGPFPASSGEAIAKSHVLAVQQLGFEAEDAENEGEGGAADVEQ